MKIISNHQLAILIASTPPAPQGERSFCWSQGSFFREGRYKNERESTLRSLEEWIEDVSWMADSLSIRLIHGENLMEVFLLKDRTWALYAS